MILAGLQFVTLQNQAVEVWTFYTFTNSKMQLLTSDLWILENCFDFLSDLPDGFIVTWKNTRKIEKIRDKLEKRCKKQFDKKMQKLKVWYVAG